jgi:hypothetical protein
VVLCYGLIYNWCVVDAVSLHLAQWLTDRHMSLFGGDQPLAPRTLGVL